MSHCCVPNIKIITKPDFSYVCEALVDIPQGTEIVTSYHHYYYHLFGSANRRKHIRNNWKFDCICKRCKVRLLVTETLLQTIFKFEVKSKRCNEAIKILLIADKQALVKVEIYNFSAIKFGKLPIFLRIQLN